jgi:hypothetical protein
MAASKNSPKKSTKTSKATKASSPSPKKERMCPDGKSADYEVGCVEIGNDGKEWTVKESTSGVSRWTRIPKKEQSDYDPNAEE